MTEIAPLLDPSDAHTMFRAVQLAADSGPGSDPEMGQMVNPVYGEAVVAQTVSGMQAWVKMAIDSRMTVATEYAELAHAGQELESAADTFMSTAGNPDVATGQFPAASPDRVAISDETSIDDPVGFLLENDKYALDMHAEAIRGTQAHVALTALHALAQRTQDPAATELWNRMSGELSRPARRLHETVLRGSRFKAKFAGYLLRVA